MFKFLYRIIDKIGICGLLCLALIVCSSCGSKKKAASKENKPILYNPASSSLHPRIGVYHLNDDESQLYIAINTKELIVTEANKDAKSEAMVNIHYDLFDCTDTENNKLITDSASFVNVVSISPQQKVLVFPISIPAKVGRRYMLSVSIRDVIRHNTVKSYLSVDKMSAYSGQNFKVTTLNGAPHPEKTVNTNDLLRINYQRQSASRLFVKYMAADAPLSNSPLSPTPSPELSFKADSIWEQAYDPNTNFMFGYEGFYLIQVDTTHQEGLLLMNFGTSYPRENRTVKLIEPIHYLLNDAQFRKLTKDSIPKKIMDDFWLSSAGSTDKARMLIRVFYTRMGYANQYFTDEREGWKTDRGQVYMVYGLPNNIHKNSDSETWEYTRRDYDPVRFSFDRKDSPYSADHFVLRRGDPQSTFWARAIDSWCKGRVFSLSELDDE